VTADEAAVRQVLRRVARRLWARRAGRRVLVVTAAGSAAACLVLLAARLGDGPWPAHLLAALGALSAAAVLPALRGVAPSSAAAALDAALGTHERFTTALASMGRADAMERLVVRDAARLCPAVDVRRVPDRAPFWPAVIATLGVAGVLILSLDRAATSSAPGAPWAAAPGGPPAAAVAAAGHAAARLAEPGAPRDATAAPRADGRLLREMLGAERRDAQAGGTAASPRAGMRPGVSDAPPPAPGGGAAGQGGEPASPAAALPGADTASASAASAAPAAADRSGTGVTTRATPGAGGGPLGGGEDLEAAGASDRAPTPARTAAPGTAGPGEGRQRAALPPALRHYVARYFQALAASPEGRR
jgi:hypothetical protein